ncbi:MAG: TonB-dependent receptor [Sphingomonadaceae bacterium]|nr:TonB-dependent receptor [Sphingomonadaceae bacterium]
MRSIRPVAAFALLLATTTAVYAQETTSSVRGEVTDASGNAVAGAAVTIRHEPSGTTTRTTTDASGQYVASGLRIGGPFTITVAAPNYEATAIDNVQLQAGLVTRIPVTLNTAAIVVTGRRGPAPTYTLSQGPVTALDAEQIKSVASVNRDIRDIVRRSPFAQVDLTNGRAIEIAGQNLRTNRFAVDGVRFSDNFGLNAGGLPTTRGPVPLDAIEQLQVKVAPFDIAEGDFTGGSVNVVLRSGGNKFTGSGFYTYSGDSLAGDTTGKGPTRQKIRQDFDSDNFGGFISGPIFKDKLFFSFSYEKLKEGRPVQQGLAGFPVPTPGLTQATVDQVSAIAQSRYGYDTLGIIGTTQETDEKATAKIDWNVSDKQRLIFTYIYNDGVNQFNGVTQNATVANPLLSLRSNFYSQRQTINSGILQLNSQWSDKLSTETRISYRNFDQSVPSLGAPGPQFNVCTDPVNPPNSGVTAGNAGTGLQNCLQGGNVNVPIGSTTLVFGPDISRQANLLNVETWQGDVTARYQAGDHLLKTVFIWQHQDVYNLFVQRFTGDYYFDSIADFSAGNANRLRLAQPIGGRDPAARYNYNQFTFALQDSWDITNNLNVTAGLRYDFFVSGSRPILNSDFVGRYGFTNQETYDGRDVLQPRFGVTWKPDRRTVVRGGGGLFAGGSADVFLSNSFSNTGIAFNSIDIQRTTTGFTVPGLSGAAATAIGQAALNNVRLGVFDPTVLNYLQTNTGALSTATVNALSPNYEIPSQWKVSLSVDRRQNLGFLGDNWNFGADILYSEVNHANDYTDLRSIQCATPLPDGRPRYVAFGGNTTTCSGGLPGTNQDLLLRSSNKGRGYVLVARFDKAWGFGLNVGASYTYQNVKDVGSVTSSTAGSNYGLTVMVDPNRAAYGRSNYETTNAIKFNVGYSHAFFGDYKTRFQMFGEWRNGRPFSYTMNDPGAGRSPVFGTLGATSRYLLYVPNVSSITADPLVTYANNFAFAAFQQFVQQNNLPQGRIVGKNTGTSPDFFKIDLHADQEIPLPKFAGYRPRVRVFADLENFLNLLNPAWGQLRQVPFTAGYVAPLVNVSCVAQGANSCAQYQYSNFSPPNVQTFGRQSLWSMRIGARFEF